MAFSSDAKIILCKKPHLNGTIRKPIHAPGPGRLAAKWWFRTASFSNLAPPPPPQRAKRLGWSWNMMTLVWLFAIAGFIVACIVYHFFSSEHYKHYEDTLVNMCDERARMLQHQFAVSMNHVHALAILVSTFHLGKYPSAIDQKTFATYTARTAFERPLMTGVAYAQRVLHAERAAFESEQGWVIRTMHSKEPSPVQDEYAPTVLFQETLRHLASLDMMSGEEDRENILRARMTGKGVLTSPFKLLESNHLGVVLTFAVYNKDLPPDATSDERKNTAAGYLGGAFDFESLVQNLLEQLAKKEAIIVNVYDVTNSTRPLVMYGPDDLSDVTSSHVSSLDFGDPYRKHEMRCRLARKPPLARLAIGFASGVLALVALICSMVYNAHMHVRKVEEDYRKMEELKVRAEAADIAKSQFLATVSHEIRTPMNGVLGMLQMLMDTELDTTQQDFARTAQASGKALITLINEVLDQAKIESGRIELEAVPFDLRTIIDDVLSLFSGKTRDKGIELAGFVSDRVPHIVVGDPGRFRQIITNLVGNSVKFTETGHIFVCVHIWEDIESVRASSAKALSKELTDGRPKFCSVIPCNTLSGFAVADQQNSWDMFELLRNRSCKPCDNFEVGDSVRLFVSVEDTGVGIPLQAQQRIFMPFMQADSSTSRTYGGTGIGLSISKCLAELMNGEMKFKSVEEVGSTFTCTLELKKGPSNWVEDKRRSLSDPLPTRFKGMRALVVDGKHVRSEVTKYHLQRLGVHVEVYHDSRAAVHVLLGQNKVANGEARAMVPLDMILVDKDAWGASTGLSFPSVISEARQKYSVMAHWKLQKEPKLILLATSITPAETEKAKAMGFVETVIMKPLRPSLMAACLQQALGLGSKECQGRGLKGPTKLHSLLHGKKILVVDDNLVNRRVAAGALKKYGASVECCDSGKAAITLLQPPHSFDACFMDIQMPEMDGFEATQHIRRIERLALEQKTCKEQSLTREGRQHVPIFAMTADVIQATPDECEKCGMDGYVSKPFEEEQLYLVVAKCLELPSTPEKSALS
ncbi:hypothetical protein GOP47_0025116 [Adiantum capillus-veneris]|uniref:histidine kinase n=1 Tax=Adiantum capillus-veneris TaxID=13818 RepID=A0A9D4U326_ADICA|nr:hypothetical protein GOP47_0024599 [Adiantum capillus-veneris]KAI5060696.1 hypothetical protein GOP47_0025116 [Adiantum capillus-veneris]